MALEQALKTVSILAGADLSSSQYLAVDVATDNSGVKVVASQGARAIGILQNKPVSGQPATVAIVGSISKAIANAAGVASAGLLLQSDNAGKMLAAATTGHYAIAISLDAAASGDVFRVLVISPYPIP